MNNNTRCLYGYSFDIVQWESVALEDVDHVHSDLFRIKPTSQFLPVIVPHPLPNTKKTVITQSTAACMESYIFFKKQFAIPFAKSLQRLAHKQLNTVKWNKELCSRHIFSYYIITFTNCLFNFPSYAP